MTEQEYFKDRNIVITGGTSGLGRELAWQLFELGANIAVIARNETKLKSLKAQVSGRGRFYTLQGDVSDKRAIYPLAGKIHASLGDVDLLLNVAGYLGQTPLRLLLDSDCEDLELGLQTNLLGPFRLTKALLPSMLLNNKGVVVNISSDAAINAYPRWGGYAISKAALDHLSRIFDEELKSQGVRFLAIDPGDMRTPMHFAANPDADPEKLRDPAESAKRILRVLAQQDFSQVRRAL